MAAGTMKNTVKSPDVDSMAVHEARARHKSPGFSELVRPGLEAGHVTEMKKETEKLYVSETKIPTNDDHGSTQLSSARLPAQPPDTYSKTKQDKQVGGSSNPRSEI